MPGRCCDSRRRRAKSSSWPRTGRTLALAAARGSVTLVDPSSMTDCSSATRASAPASSAAAPAATTDSTPTTRGRSSSTSSPSPDPAEPQRSRLPNFRSFAPYIARDQRVCDPAKSVMVPRRDNPGRLTDGPDSQREGSPSRSRGVGGERRCAGRQPDAEGDWSTQRHLISASRRSRQVVTGYWRPDPYTIVVSNAGPTQLSPQCSTSCLLRSPL